MTREQWHWLKAWVGIGGFYVVIMLLAWWKWS